VHTAQRFLGFSVPKRAALVYIISVKMMALSGVRSSWLMLVTNCDLCSLAILDSFPRCAIAARVKKPGAPPLVACKNPLEIG